MDFTTGVRTLGQDIDEQLIFCTKNGCSDLFVKVGEPATIYQYGIIYNTLHPTDEIAWNNFANKAITSEQNAKYVRDKMLDFSYEANGLRYRVNCSFSQGQKIATFRMISDKLPTFNSLKLDDNVVALLERAFSQKQGISMLVGATGSGKTSTLAACINSFSAGFGSRKELPLKDSHMITLEDPIEYIYPSTGSTLITQKELGRDFMSFELGIKSSLREHPTHMLVGETRDKETIRALVECSRTGHSCLTTFHTSSVSDTLARIYSYLAGENQDVMFDLIANLNFILCQQLIKSRKGYKMRYQYMFFTEQVKKVLVEAIYRNKNIPNTVENLMKNEQLLKANLCSGWKQSI